ncbi:MAG TPA: hypothetical protein VKX28_28150 [Xanthobacteraceae bacterium]|nr:hypothetical protein [Xanthobacteraceae bacterium]
MDVLLVAAESENRSMNAFWKIARVAAVALWLLLGGAFGATIVFAGVLWWFSDLPLDAPLNAGDAMGTAAAVGMALFCAPLGLFAGLGCALYLLKRQPLFRR